MNMSLINNIYSEEINLESYTLIIPSVSVGNVGQLTIDLLISSLKMEKVGIIWHPAIFPCVGSDPINKEENEICTACELYASKKEKLAVIQLRSTLEFALALNFFKKLKEELVKFNLKNVIILSSTYAYEMHNINLSPFLYLTNETTECDLLQDVRKFEPNESGKYEAFGSGFAIKLYEILSDHIKCTIFLKYTSEGDNRPDAEQMFNVVVKYLKVRISKMVVPTSWKFAFGNPPPVDIY